LSLLLTERMAPELLYLEIRWASLMCYGMTADLLKDILPIGGSADPSTIRRHLHKAAARHEADLASEQPGGLDDGPGKGQPLPQAAVIVGINGGYIRNWHDKRHNFEVVVGKSMAAGRNDRYFVRSQDEQPLPQGSAHSSPAGDPNSHDAGGDSVAGLVGELSPGAVHIVDWFHIAMRLTGLDQYVKGLAHHNPV
jgi:hypothetical protein